MASRFENDISIALSERDFMVRSKLEICNYESRNTHFCFCKHRCRRQGRPRTPLYLVSKAIQSQLQEKNWLKCEKS